MFFVTTDQGDFCVVTPTAAGKYILMVLTSHDQLGNTGYRTGFWLEGFTTAYYALADAGAEIVLASPLGGQPPIDPRSDDPVHPDASVRRFRQDRQARELLADTLRLDQVAAADFDAAMIAGGYGAMWDLAEHPLCSVWISTWYAVVTPVALVCHGPAVLRHAVDAQGLPLVCGKAVTGFANSEEAAAGLTGVLPFLLQDELIRLGAHYSKGADGASYVVRDGSLITGQNVASVAAAAAALLTALDGVRS
jgi:putative intracellular protease/amidase